MVFLLSMGSLSMLRHEYAIALDAAKRFASLGLVALPSCMDRKRPMLHDASRKIQDEYKQYRTERVPGWIYQYDEWNTTNLQLMTGVETSGATKIAVVDLDGPEAIVAWKAICKKNDFYLKSNVHFPWISSTGSGGTHIYFRVQDVPRLPSRMIWGLYDTLTGWVKHREIRLLGDRSLVVAPPSLRVDGVGCYSWHGRYNPRTIPLPEIAPDWLLAMPGVITPQRQPYNQPEPKHVDCSHLKNLRQVIIAKIPPQQKVEIAKTWGLRFAESYPSLRQKWIPCHAIDREDKMPSAGFDAETGVYSDRGGNNTTLSFFDLAVALCVFKDWKEAEVALANQFNITR